MPMTGNYARGPPLPLLVRPAAGDRGLQAARGAGAGGDLGVLDAGLVLPPRQGRQASEGGSDHICDLVLVCRT